MYNSYAQAVGYTEVLSGLRRRMRNRLVNDNGEDGDIVKDIMMMMLLLLRRQVILHPWRRLQHDHHSSLH